jgi:hypothetical protein
MKEAMQLMSFLPDFATPRVGQNRIYIYIYTLYDPIFGDFPAKNTVFAPNVYDSGEPYT